MQLSILKEIINLKNSKKEFSVITNLDNSRSYIYFKDQNINSDLDKFKEVIAEAQPLELGREKGVVNQRGESDEKPE